MTGANHPRFRLLIGWCCLMSSALLIIAVYLIIQKTENGKPNSPGEYDKYKGNTEQQTGLPSVPSLNNYIHLIRDNEIWISEPAKNSSLSPVNNTVKITVSGLYYFHAQVTFPDNKNQATVILRKNKANGTKERFLSVVKHFGSGTATMIRLVELTYGDSISLEIDPINNISRQPYDTYWEIMFFET